jgi:hypothetical protein
MSQLSVVRRNEPSSPGDPTNHHALTRLLRCSRVLQARGNATPSTGGDWTWAGLVGAPEQRIPRRERSPSPTTCVLRPRGRGATSPQLASQAKPQGSIRNVLATLFLLASAVGYWD